jgi:hypothetical protein
VGELDPEDIEEGLSADELQELVAAVGTTCAALEGQVRPDESDYIAEGLIDPNGVSDSATEIPDVGESWQDWDCTESWWAYRSGDGLYINWRRAARGHRHGRDLWVLVDEDFFFVEEDD